MFRLSTLCCITPIYSVYPPQLTSLQQFILRLLVMLPSRPEVLKIPTK